MRKKRILSLVLSVCMLIACVQMPVVWAEDTATSYSLSELLGEYCAVRNIDQTDYTVTSGTKSFSNPTDGNAALGSAGDATEIKLKVNIDTTDSDQEVQMQIYDSENKRVYMSIHDAGAWMSHSDTSTYGFTSEQVEKIRNKEITLLYVNDGATFSLYLKEDTGKFSKLVTTTGKRSGSTNSTYKCVRVGASGGASAYVEYIKYYDGDFLGTDCLIRGVDTTGYTANGGTAYCSTIGSAALGEAGDAVEMKLNATIDTADEDQAVTIQIPDSDGNRVYMSIHDAGAWITKDVNNSSYSFTSKQVTKIRNTDATLVYVNNGDSYSLYVKENDGSWLLLVKTDSKRTGASRTNVSVGAAGGAKCVVDYIKYFDAEGLADSDAKAENCFKVYEQEFDAAEMGGDNTITDGVVCEEGSLSMPAGGEVYFNGAPIPLGGYAEMKIKTADKLTVRVSDDTAGNDIYFRIYAESFSNYTKADGNHGAFLSGAENRADEWHTFRIVRDADENNVYAIYHKGENDGAWIKVLDAVNTGERDADMKAFYLKAEHGTALIDYIEIYSPAGEDGLLVTDGSYKTQAVESGSAITDTDELRAMVCGKSGSLIFAGYDENECLVTASIRPVDGTAAVDDEFFDTTVDEDIAKVKVFLWNADTLAPQTASCRSVYTDIAYVEKDVELLFNNSAYDLSDLTVSPQMVNGTVYMPAVLVSELTDYEAEISENTVTFSGGGDTIAVTADSTVAKLNNEDVSLANAPIVKSGEIMLSLEDVTALLPIGEDVTPYSGGIALHSEYYDDDTSFFNLATTFSGDPTTQRGFSWEAVPGYTSMVIEYSEGASLINAVQKTASYTAEPVVYNNYNWTDPEARISYYDNMLFYKVGLDDLKADTTYSYRIGDTEKNEWSDIYTFKTAGEAVDEFSVIAIADTQSQSENEFAYYRQTMEKAFEECADPAFVMHMGDITENGMCDDWWNMYFEASDSFTQSVPTVAVAGNHETRANGMKYFNLHFMNPQNGAGLAEDIDYAKVNKYDEAVLDQLDNTVYSFDYGDVHFAVLNTGSDWMESTYVVDLQKEWLKNDIKENGKTWNVVLLHIGIYPAQERAASVSHLYELMDECDIDMVLQGHDHITMRTKPMTGTEYGAYAEDTDNDPNTVSEGTVYQIMGCAGTKRYTYSTLPDDEWVEVAETTGAYNPSYNILKFSKDSISVVSKALDGTELDKYTITK